MSLSTDTTMTMPVMPAYNGMGYNNGGMFGGDWFAWIIILLLFGGRWGNGFGGDSSCCAPATCADLQRGFDNQGVTNKLNGLENGLCSLGYDQLREMNGINTNVLQTGFGIQNAIQQGTVSAMQNTNALQTQLSNCCCGLEKGQMQITNSMDSGFCQTNYNLATNTNSIIQNARADTDRVIAKLDAMEMARKDETISELRSQVNALNLAQSQANQNTYLINTLRPCPIPAYPACPPAGAYTWPANGCGCNSCC